MTAQDEKHSTMPDVKTVYYDGSCPMCTVFVEKIKSSKAGDVFCAQDITKDPLPLPLTRKAIEKEIHVVGEDGKLYKNADAILSLLEVYPSWKPVVRIGRLPVFRNVFTWGYNFIARNRHFIFGPASPLFWTKIVAVLGFLSGILLSIPLWLSERPYPLSPVIHVFVIPPPFDLTVFVLLVSSLVGILLTSHPKKFLVSILCFASLMIFADQSRFQPWVYFYMLILAVLALFSWNYDDKNGQEKTLHVLQFIVSTIYIWSGLQKLNTVFYVSVFPWMAEPIVNILPSSFYPLFLVFDLAVPLIEMGIGIGFFTRRFRKASIVGAVMMCVFVLWALGPFGHSWNSVVWPWNIALLLFVFILFRKNTTLSLHDLLPSRFAYTHKIFFLLCGVLPLFYFVNVWDAYPSWSLYSGTVNRGTVILAPTMSDKVPSGVLQYAQKNETGEYHIDIMKWSYDVMNVPVYPEKRVFISIADTLCVYAEKSNDVTLVVEGRRTWFFNDPPSQYDCEELK